jgi:hypothetical protein
MAQSGEKASGGASATSEASGSASGGGSNHEELWRTFTRYAVAGDPRRPDALRVDQWVRLCEDCRAVGPRVMRAEAAALAVRQASVQAAEAAGHGVPQRCLGYHAFLSCCLDLAQRLFPDASTEEAMQLFLQRHVAPHAKRRARVSVAYVMANRAVQKLLHRFGPSLERIFRYYATVAERESGPERCGKNTMKDEMTYAGFTAFAMDFGLSNTSLISTTTMADIFLGSIAAHAFKTAVPKLTLREFIEALVRCAVVIGKVAPPGGAPHATQLKALLLVMWRAVHAGNNLATSIESTKFYSNTNASDILHGIMTFNNKFVEMWQHDGRLDYLGVAQAPKPDAFDIVSRTPLADWAVLKLQEEQKEDMESR